MNTPTQQFPKNDNIPESSPGPEATESTTNKPDDSDLLNRSAFRRDSGSRSATKKVKIVDPKQNVEGDSDEEDSISQPNTGNIPVLGESVSAVNCGQANDQQAASAASIDRKKTKEERKKEREKKKEEEMLKKYQAEQEAKQKISAKSKCGRWIKHNLKIGEGGYKFVYRGYDSVEARNVAWCEFKREHVDTKEKRQAMFRETEIMLKMNHPHIVRCFDVFREWIDMEDPNNQIEEKGVVIIQELMGEGTLKSIIKKNFLDGQCILKFPLITRWWHQILDALRYMHHKIQPPILHRDLKADNCFLYGASDEEYLNVKVGDFGLATHVSNSGRKTMLGTLGFMAPEIFDEKYDEKVDIYAFGMLMLEVMTNRTPYDECETVLQVAAKTMSGQGPDIMQMVSNPSLREVICACIQPLTCFRPTADELYFHPLFQPKTLPVEVEPNYDNATDRAEVLDRFVRSLGNPETRNPNFNLRLRFRDKKMLQELGLDDGESLEFDLDIYKAEDQDIPDLIHNLRLGYEDKLWRVFENPKQPDKKIVSNHLDKLFSSIRLQMQFLVKVLLGKRWKAILDSLVEEQRTRKKQEGASTIDEDDQSDTDAYDTSSFTIIGKYKSKWNRAKKLLEKEIQAYRNLTAVSSAGSSAVTCSAVTTGAPAVAVSGTSVTPLIVGGMTQPQMDTNHIPLGGTNIMPPGQILPGPQSKISTESIDMHCQNLEGSNQVSVPNSGLTSIGKFTVTIPPSATAAPVTPNILPLLSNNGSTPTPTPASTPIPPQTAVAQKTSEPHVSAYPNNSSVQHPSSISMNTDVNAVARRPVPDHCTTCNTTYISSQPSVVSLAGASQQGVSQKQPLQFQTQQSAPVMSTLQSQAGVFIPSQASVGKSDAEVIAANNMDTIARSAMILQQVLQGITSTSVANSCIPSSETVLGSQMEGVNQGQLVNTGFMVPLLSDSHSTMPQLQQPTIQYNQQFPSQVSAMNVNDNTVSSMPSMTPGLGVIGQNTSAAQNEGFVQPESDIHPKTDQSQLLINSEHVSLINQLTEVLMNNAAQGLLLGGNNYMLNSQPTQQTLPNSQPSLSQLPSRQVSLQHQQQQPPQQQQQQNQPRNTAPNFKPIERRTRKKVKSKPRYVLRVTKIERDFEGCEPDNLRPTFYLEMPDLNNPNNELWKITFRCNLSDTPEDIKLFQGSGYTPANEDIDRAAKEAVMTLLEALRNDVNSVKLNQDYVFYPRPSTAGVDQTSISHLPGLPNTLNNTSVVQCNAPVNSAFTGTFGAGGVAVQNTNTGLTYPSAAATHDGSAFMSHFEEIQPLDSKNHEDEDEFSENSRPLSPVDNGNQPMNFPFQPVINGVETLNNYKTTNSSQCMSYYTVSSCAESLPSSDSIQSSKPRSELREMTESAVGSDIPNNNFVPQSLLPMNLNYVNDILSLAGGRAENGVNFITCQPGLEEVPPLVPPHSDKPGATFVGDSGSTSCNESTSYDPSMSTQPDNTAYQGYAAQSIYTTQQSNHVSCNHGGVNYTSSSPFNPEGLVTVTITIPSVLETTLRSLVSKLCSNPSHPCILIPTLESNDPSSVPHCSSVRVVDIPEGHIFAGVPGDGRMPSGAYLRSTFLTSAKNDTEKAFVLVADTHSDDSFSGPHIYKLPRDSALILTHNGNIHLLDRPALVVPVRSADQNQSVSPPSSPDHSSGIQPIVSSVYVRELPMPADTDALSFDDVLALLLALRDAPQGAMQPYHLNMTMNADNENTQIESKTMVCDSVPGAESLSRRSSAAATVAPTTSGFYASQAQPVSTSGMTPSQPSQSLLSQPQQIQNPHQTGMQSAPQFPIPVSMGHQSTNQLPGAVSSNVAASRLSLPNQMHPFIQPIGQPSPLQSIPPSTVDSHNPGATAYMNQSYPSNDVMQSSQSMIAQNQLSLPVNNVYLQQQLLSMKTQPEHMSVTNQTHINPSCLSNLQQSIMQQQAHLPTQPTQPKESQQQTGIQSNTQQLLQLLSALNTLQTLDQVPQFLSNLLKTSSQVTNPSSKSVTNPGVVSTAPTVGVVRHQRQLSPPVSTQSAVPASTQPQASHIPQRLSVASPPVPNLGSCSASVNSLPVLLSRLLASAAANSEWSKLNEINKPQGVQMRPSFLATNLSSGASTVENQDNTNVQSVVKAPTSQTSNIHSTQPSHQQQQQPQMTQIPSHHQPTQIHSQLQHSSQILSQQQASQMQSHTQQQSQTPPVPTQQQTSQISGQAHQLNQLQSSAQPTQMQQHQQAAQILSQAPSHQIQQQQPPSVTPPLQTNQMIQQPVSQVTVQQPIHQTQSMQSTQQQTLPMQTHQQLSQQSHALHPSTLQHFQHHSQQLQWQQPQHLLNNIIPKLSAPAPSKDRNQQQLSLPAAHTYLSQILPELANAVRLLQQTPDSNSAGLLSVDVQNKLITLLQQQQQQQQQQQSQHQQQQQQPPPPIQHQQSQQQQQSVQQVQNQTQPQSVNHDVTFNCTGTNVAVPSCLPGNGQILNMHPISTTSKLPIPSTMNLASMNRFNVTPSPVSSNTSVPMPICSVASNCTRDHLVSLDVAKDMMNNVDHSLVNNNIPTESNMASTRPINPGGTTIANKFTVAPASLEDDDTVSSSAVVQGSTSNQRQQAPPRPPRQQRNYAGSTLGMHTSTESLGHGSVGTGNANVNMTPSMNHGLPVGTLTSVNSASNAPSAPNKAVPYKYPTENIPSQHGPSTTTMPTTTLTAALPQINNPHQSTLSSSIVTNTVPLNTVHLTTTVNSVSTVSSQNQPGSQLPTSK